MTFPNYSNTLFYLQILVQMQHCFASIFRNYLVKSDTAEQLIGTKDLLILQQFGMTQLSSCGFDYEDWQMQHCFDHYMQIKYQIL